MEPIQVAIRVRPFLPHENEYNTTIDISNEDDRKIFIQKGNKKFNGYFDKIFSQKSTQENVFKFISPIFRAIYKGINTTILAYGQTGSGKTYTMFGKDFTMNDNYYDKKNSNKLKKDKYNFLVDKDFIIDPFSETNGIIPRVVLELFKYKQSSIITCSYIQVYNEKIYDLLIDNTFKKDNNKNINFETGLNNNRTEKIIDQENLKIRDDKKYGPIVDGALELEANNFFDVFQMLRIGELNRKKRHTNKNELSSRSHSIFIIYYNNKQERKTSKIYLCDLAGSEKYDTNENYKQVHFNELKSINKSLSILGNVIHALAKKKKVHIPYKDSTLTHLLSKSLDSKTFLISTISPSDSNFEDSLNTLSFADRAHAVSTKVIPNTFEENLLDGNGMDKITIKKLSQELKELRQLLKIRSKRGTLDPIQKELIKLKEENNELKKSLNNPNIQKLIKENELLRKELQKYSFSQTPHNLTENTESNQFSTFTYDNYNNFKYDLSPNNYYKSNKNLYDNINSNDIFSSAGKNIISSQDFSNKKLGKNKNNYISYINNGRGKSSKLPINNNLIDISNKKLKMYDDLQMKNKLKTEELVNEMNNKNFKIKKNKEKKVMNDDFPNDDDDEIKNFDIGNDEDFDV